MNAVLKSVNVLAWGRGASPSLFRRQLQNVCHINEYRGSANHRLRGLTGVSTNPASGSFRGGSSTMVKYGSSLNVLVGIRRFRAPRRSIRNRPASYSASLTYAAKIDGSPSPGDATAKCNACSLLLATIAICRLSSASFCGMDFSQKLSGFSVALASSAWKFFLMATSLAKRSSNETGRSRNISEIKRARRASSSVSTLLRLSPEVSPHCNPANSPM